jgi:hypothetical protein
MSKLVSSMSKELDYYWSLGEIPEKGAASSLIYKVQQHIRESNKHAYEPFVLSIGPYHHGAACARAMENEKWKYLDYLLKLNCEKHLTDYLRMISDLAKEARFCYSEDIKMSDEDFIQMLLLDGCFILVALGGTNDILTRRERALGENVEVQTDTMKAHEQVETSAQHPDHRLSTESTSPRDGNNHEDTKEDTDGEQYNSRSGEWMVKFIDHDLRLLENQIPFFVVRKIYELVTGSQYNADRPFTDEFTKHVENSLRFYPKSIQETKPKDFYHLLHLYYMYFKPSQKLEEEHQALAASEYIYRFLCFGRKYLKIEHPEENEQSSSIQLEVDYIQTGEQLHRWRRATQYVEAGIKFKKRDYDKLDPHSMLDIKFIDGTMEVPCLVVDEHTEFLFRNLIAFEQTCPQVGDDFTAYIVFLSQVSSMPEDVTLLAQRGIIVHHLDCDADISDIFTMLSKDVVFDFNGNYYLKRLCQTMEAHYQSRLNRWIAWLWLNHFSNPWLVLAAFSAVVVLICTIVQTVYTTLAYIRPPT